MRNAGCIIISSVLAITSLACVTAGSSEAPTSPPQATPLQQPTPHPRINGYILGPEDGSKALSHLIKADPQLGSNRLGMGKQGLRAGGGIALHIHEGEDEILYVESGRGVGVVGNQQKELAPGSMIYIPQGAWHGIRSTEEMKIIWIVSPPNFANYLREWHALNESGQFTEKRYEEIQRKHQYSAGRVFLSAVLGNSVWEGPRPWDKIKFDAVGMKATYGGNGRTAGVIEIQDSSPDALGFWANGGRPPRRSVGASRFTTTLPPEPKSLSSGVMILTHKALGEGYRSKC